MFCSNCGEKLNENVKFCSGCGAKVGEVHNSIVNSSQRVSNIERESKYNLKTKVMQSTNYIMAFISAIVLIVLMFQKWIKLNFFVEQGFTLYNIQKMSEQIESVIGEVPFSIKATMFIGFILFVVSMIYLLLFIFKLITDFENAVVFGQNAMVLIICFTIFVIGMIFFFGEEIFKVTIIPYIAGALAIYCKVDLLNKLHNEIYTLSRDAEDEFYINKRKNLYKVKCPKCNYVYDNDYRSCPNCSYKSDKDIEVWICKDCETQNPMNKLFCKGCGKTR
ncbi:MAG: zinc-ribbon domain-containing protein [bacterium]